MQRNVILDLAVWKVSKDHRSMVLKCARQVGKTWLMKEFGQTYYSSYVDFHFDEEEGRRSFFEKTKNPHLKF